MVEKMATVKELAKLFNEKLYAAARKAGQAEELARAQAEVFVYEFKGERSAYVSYEHELNENENFVKPVEALERAATFLSKLAPRYGVKAVA